jgi:hypothetical protein
MKQIDPPVDVPSLIDVQLAFTHWRNTRTVRGSTPDRLRGLAVDLLHRHQYVTVCEALGVNATALKQWARQIAAAPGNDDQPVEFITLPIGDEQPPELKQCHLTINLPNGVQVYAQGSYTLTQLFAAASELSASV